MQKSIIRKPLSILLSLLMALSVFGGMAFTAGAAETFTITWRNYNGDVLETDSVAEGETPTYDGAAPVMGSDPLYTYNWSGWTAEVAPATADATYIAAFDAAPNAEPAAESLVGLKLCLNWAYDFGGAYVLFYTNPTSLGSTELVDLRYSSYSNAYQLGLKVQYSEYSTTSYTSITTLDGLTAAGIEITGGAGTQGDPYIMSLIYSTPYVAANGISVAPDWSSAFVVDRVIPVTATLDPKWAVCNVAWSVEGDSIALYADKECATPVGDATNLSTVYAKGVSVGDAVITATDTANASVTASCNASVLESDPVIGLKCYKDWIFDLPSDVYYSAVKTTSGYSNWAEKLSGFAPDEPTPAGNNWLIWFRTDNNSKGYYFDKAEGTPTGIQIVSGSGVKDDPYMMELLYEEAPAVSVDSVSLPSAAKVFEGESVAVTARVNPKAEIENVKPKYADNQQVVWSVDNDNVTLYTDAECTTPVGSEATDALTVYAKGVNVGTAAVTAASAENLELTATTNVKVCDLSEKLSVNYELTDSYGWSWDGAKILIREKGSDNVVATLTMDFDYDDEKVKTITDSAALFKGANYELVWMQGEYDEECSFTITNPFTGEAISASDCTGYANGQVIATLIDPAVEAAKEAAAEALDTYVNADDYREAEQAQLAEAVAAGKAAIAATESLDALEEAVAAAQAAIDAIKTDAELTAEELAAAKEAAKAELDAYKNADDYRDAEKADLVDAIAAGKDAIDDASDTDAVVAALAAAKAAMDEIKTDAELTAEEEAAEAAANQAAADEASALIDAIGEVAYTDESKDKIDAARAAYDALTDDQKALVENAETLTAAEAKYAELKAAAETPAEPETPDDPAGSEKPHGEHCFCYNVSEDSTFGSLLHFICGIINALMSFLSVLGVAA